MIWPVSGVSWIRTLYPAHANNFSYSWPATPYDELWAIDTEERLRGHVTRTYRPPLYELMLDEAVDDDDQCEQPVSSRDVLDKDDGSWEFLWGSVLMTCTSFEWCVGLHVVST